MVHDVTAVNEAVLRDLTVLDTEHLLASQGDDRHLVLASGANRYFNRYRPEPDLLRFGSCTSSTLSRAAFASAERLHGWLRSVPRASTAHAIDDLFERVRTQLIGNLAPYRVATTDVVVTPSGSDAEFIPLLVGLAGGRRVTNIVVGAAEAGSGSIHAAGGLHFDHATPFGVPVQQFGPVNEQLSSRVDVVRVDVRDCAGDPRPVSDIDAEVTAIAEGRVAGGEDVLLHLIAHSKTGLHAPSIETVARLTGAHPGRVLAVIDGAQGRFSRRGLEESLARGWMTIVTGSKFFGGPPFAGAVLVPHTLWADRDRPALPDEYGDYLGRSMLPRTWTRARAAAPDIANVGLLLRWWSALTEIREYYSVPAPLRFEVLQTFQALVPTILARIPEFDADPVDPPVDPAGAVRLLESNTTVFPFTCRVGGAMLDDTALRTARERLRLGTGGGLRAEIGQPVVLGAEGEGRTVLRVALGAPNNTDVCTADAEGSTFFDRMSRLETDVDQVLHALAEQVRAVGADAASASGMLTR
ncbi:hypothetical protein [Ruania alba]|nr:hypothetical protein [Ruania alba]